MSKPHIIVPENPTPTGLILCLQRNKLRKEENYHKHFLFFSTANPCPVPFVIPENALLSEKEFYVDQNVSIKCREGFLLQGQGIITCNSDETWTQTSAKCESKSTGGHQSIAYVQNVFSSL